LGYFNVIKNTPPTLDGTQHNMKNLSLILNVILLAAVGHLYYLNFKKPAATEQVIAPPANMKGLKIAYVNSDTLDAKYEWLKQRREALNSRLANAQNSLASKYEALQKEQAAFAQKYEAGNTPPAELQAEYEGLQNREKALMDEERRLSKSLGDDQAKALKEMNSDIESKLKSIQSQIGYDYILAYTKGGGQVMLANDSLDITKQVLQLLNAKEEKKN
jgi:outer membrane protein